MVFLDLFDECDSLHANNDRLQAFVISRAWLHLTSTPFLRRNLGIPLWSGVHPVVSFNCAPAVCVSSSQTGAFACHFDKAARTSHRDKPAMRRESKSPGVDGVLWSGNGSAEQVEQINAFG